MTSMTEHDPIHVYISADPGDPREGRDLPAALIAHPGPRLHPDDCEEVDGLPVTSPSRTLIDLAEVMDAEELRAAFVFFRDRGLLDPQALTAARGRVEWRPTLALFDEVRGGFGV